MTLKYQFQIGRPFSFGSRATLMKYSNPLSLRSRLQSRQAVGILVDANDDVTGRWEAIQESSSGKQISTHHNHPSPDGTIIQANPHIGIWLMPDNLSAGELEDFVVQMIPEGDQVWPLSQRYIEEIPQEERKFSDGKVP